MQQINKSILLLSFVISLVYLPYLLAVNDVNGNFISNKSVIIASTLFFIFFNLRIILFFEDASLKKKLFINTILLPITNLILLFILPLLNLISVEGNVFAFSLIMIIPIWIIILIISIKMYERSSAKKCFLKIINMPNSDISPDILKDILNKNGFYLYNDTDILELNTGKLYSIQLKEKKIILTDKNDTTKTYSFIL